MNKRNGPTAESNQLGAKQGKRGTVPGFSVQQEPAGVQPGVPPTITVTPRLLYDVREAAELLSISPANLRALIVAGRIGSCKLGGRRLLHWSQIEAFARAVMEGGE